MQQAAALGTSILIAVSAPTVLAVRAALDRGMTPVGIVRGDDFEVFRHPEAIAFD